MNTSSTIRFLRVASDLHMEWRSNYTVLKDSLGEFKTPFERDIFKFIPRDPRDEESCMILAGDIGSNRKDLEALLRICEQRFPLTIYVPGNHEFWYEHVDRWEEFRGLFVNSPRLYVAPAIGLGHLSLAEGKLNFFAGTMWPDCAAGRPLEEMAVAECHDFAVEKFDNRLVTVSDYREWNAEFSRVLYAQLERLEKKEAGKTIVITHHLPSYHLCSSRYHGSQINGLFAANLDRFFGEEFSPDVWIHGHTHSFTDRFLGHRTRVVCNPLGYPAEFNEYRPSLFLDLEQTYESKCLLS